MRQVKPDQFLILNQKGQAVLEYILVLVVIVSLVLAAGKMFGSLDKFMAAYMGNYISCLMEHGELPSLGVEDSDLKQHKEGGGKTCNAQYASFTFGSGRPSLGSGSNSSSGGSSSSNSKNFRNSSNNADNKSSDSNAEDKNSGSRRNASSNFSSSGRSDPYGSGQISRYGAAGTADGASATGDQSKTKVVGVDESDETRSGSSVWGDGGRRSDYQNRPRYKAITGALADEEKKKIEDAKKRAPTSTVLTKPDEIDSGFGPRRSTFVPPQPAEAGLHNESDTSLGIGGFIKWLLIAAMIVGVVVFFGSQILNYSNSKE